MSQPHAPETYTPTNTDRETALLLVATAGTVDDTDGNLDTILHRAGRAGWLIVHADGTPPTPTELGDKAAALAPLFTGPDVRLAGRDPLTFVISLHALAGAHASLNRPDPPTGSSTRDRIGAGR